MARWILIPLLALAAGIPAVHAAPKADLWARWEAHDPGSTQRVDHRPWQAFLGRYLDTAHSSGIHRVRYAGVAAADRQALAGYLQALQTVGVTHLNRAEQRAYWINLYNALTVQVVLHHYPVQSIRDIGISPGWFARGPWGAKLATVEGEPVALDDIEHRILRPIWRDPRLHYAVNCASLGCPDLPAEAFTAENTERLLDEGARAYVNHPRGVDLREGRLRVSSIYAWFQADFGGDAAGVIAHLRRYADPDLASRLAAYRGTLDDAYDWSLNE